MRIVSLSSVFIPLTVFKHKHTYFQRVIPSLSPQICLLKKRTEEHGGMGCVLGWF